MTVLTESQLGVIAFNNGESIDANPYPRNSEEAGAWVDGYRAAEARANPRVASKQEVAAANQLTDLSQFRRRYRRY